MLCTLQEMFWCSLRVCRIFDFERFLILDARNFLKIVAKQIKCEVYLCGGARTDRNEISTRTECCGGRHIFWPRKWFRVSVVSDELEAKAIIDKVYRFFCSPNRSTPVPTQNDFQFFSHSDVASLFVRQPTFVASALTKCVDIWFGASKLKNYT